MTRTASRSRTRTSSRRRARSPSSRRTCRRAWGRRSPARCPRSRRTAIRRSATSSAPPARPPRPSTARRRSRACSRETTRPEDAVTRLLTAPVALTDATIARVTDVDPTEVARARRRNARSALVGRPASTPPPRSPFTPRPAATGSRNSSLTRVQPVFGAALERDPTGASWLPALLAAAPDGATLPDAVRARARPAAAGRQRDPRRHRPRARTRRARAVLRAPDRPLGALPALVHRPPRAADLAAPASSSRPTPSAGAGRCSSTSRPGGAPPRPRRTPSSTRLGPTRGHGKWWVFEGRTAADCLLVTDRLALFIEGKRTDRIAPATSWYPWRSQLVRNLEAVHGSPTAVTPRCC